ncbi:MAG: ATP-binding protein, partial [Euryarchaeota archaeon]|nr:ATP-binding protein [Euryarchaeota archaeon]
MARENTKDNVILNCSEKIEESVGAAENVFKFSKQYQELGVEEPEWRDMRTSCENGIFDINLNSIILRNDLGGLEIYTDSLIEKVFYNLADNTIRHGGEVSEINVYYKEIENGLLLIYEDDGVGVPESKKEIIFERGYGDNTGYGLDLIKRIFEISGMG